MKYVTLKMSKGEDITLPYEQAKRVLEGREQMVMVNNERGEWTGIVVNKAYVVSSDINVEQSKPERITRKDRLIEGPDGRKINPDDYMPGFIKEKRQHHGERKTAGRELRKDAEGSKPSGDQVLPGLPDGGAPA